MNADVGEITRVLIELNDGNKEAESRLMHLVYAELRRIAANHLRREWENRSLQPTELVHEAYLRLAQVENLNWQNRSHFYAMAARTMRRVLVDYARAKDAGKRGDGVRPVELIDTVIGDCPRTIDILILDQALSRLAEFDERAARIVELRYFVGMTEEEIATSLNVSVRTVKRDWNFAKPWLKRELQSSPS